MELSPIGRIARCDLLKTPEIRYNVVIDEWVIMPDHIHVIYRKLLIFHVSDPCCFVIPDVTADAVQFHIISDNMIMVPGLPLEFMVIDIGPSFYH